MFSILLLTNENGYHILTVTNENNSHFQIENWRLLHKMIGADKYGYDYRRCYISRDCRRGHFQYDTRQKIR